MKKCICWLMGARKGVWALLVLVSACECVAQSTAYTASGGLVLAVQQGPGAGSRQPLFASHADLGIEWQSDWNTTKTTPVRPSFLLRLGYHPKGSSVRYQFVDPNNTATVLRGNMSNRYHNIALMPAVASAYQLGEHSTGYWLLGVRGEYTIRTVFDYNQQFENYVRRLQAGFTVGGGINFEWERVAAFFELRVSPDATNQIFIPQGAPIVIPGGNGTFQNSITTSETRIRNVVFEVALGFKLIQHVVYVD